jgi:hypothetical protein
VNRRRALAVLTAGLSGGCLQLSGGNDTETPTRTTTDRRTTTSRQTPTDSPTPTESETPTESPTPTESETPTERPAATLPAGLTEDGPNNLLYSLHLSTLGSKRFHAEWTKLDRRDGSLDWQKEYDSEPGRAVGRATVRRGGGGPADIYRTGDEHSLWREQIGGSYTYGRDDNGWNVGKITFGVEVAPLVEIVDWGPPTRVDDGRPAVWELSADGLDSDSPVPGHTSGGSVESISGGMQVDERGVIRSMTVEYAVDPDYDTDELNRYTTTLQIDQIGAVSVSPPSWVSRASARRPQMTVTKPPDGAYVAFEHTGGSRLEPGTRLQVYDEVTGGPRDYEIDDPIEAGETVYLSKRGEEGVEPELEFSREPPTAVARTFDGDVDYGARRSTLNYFKIDNVR